MSTGVAAVPFFKEHTRTSAAGDMLLVMSRLQWPAARCDAGPHRCAGAHLSGWRSCSAPSRATSAPCGRRRRSRHW